MKEHVGSLLVVDDDPMNREGLSRRLEKHGFTVQSADNGSMALDLIARGGVELVLLDVEMPGLNGLQVLNRIRKRHSRLQLPVIMVTGRCESHDIVEALSLGANDFVAKPIDLPVTIARISTHLSLRRTDQALEARERRYALAARGAGDGLWDWDLTTNEIYFSLDWKSMLGYQEHEIGNRVAEWFDRLHPDDVDGLQAKIQEHLEGHSTHFEHEHRILDRDGTYRWVVNRGLAVRDVPGRAIRMAGSQRDVTLARVTDLLTGLPNRIQFLERLENLFQRSKARDGYVLGVLVLELVGFKAVNDSFGRPVGDQLLITISKRLVSCLRSEDMLARLSGPHTVARIGGDEFCILLDDIKSVENAARVTERLLEEIAAPYNLDGHDLFVSASVGIALNRPDHEHAEDIMRDANIAVNSAKMSGRTHYQVFDSSMRDYVRVRMLLETELHRALKRDELHCDYQIIVSTKTWKIAGFEALIRWHHPTRGLIMPDQFIPIAEESGMIVDVDQTALRLACSQLRLWHDRPEDRHWTMSVNLSAKQFMTANMVERIQRTLEETGLEARFLRLEVTESLVMRDLNAMKTGLQQLSDLGLQLAIDDFGIGYSSFGYLHQLPFNTLKIDRSFVDRMTKSSKNAAIISAIVALAHNLGLNVIAEGVETEAQLRQLEKFGCEYVQGYYLARPMPAAAVESLVAHWNREEQTMAAAMAAGRL